MLKIARSITGSESKMLNKLIVLRIFATLCLFFSPKALETCAVVPTLMIAVMENKNIQKLIPTLRATIFSFAARASLLKCAIKYIPIDIFATSSKEYPPDGRAIFRIL